MKVGFSKVCSYNQADCVIEINFYNPIDFKYLTIVKWMNDVNLKERFKNMYKNVCLTLDDENKLCTPNWYGFDVKSNSPPYEIDFILPKTRTKKVRLSFHETQLPLGHNGNYHAQIADLKIRYSDASG